MDIIKKDLVRFSTLHLWFKLLPYEGREYLAFPWKGEQPRNCISPRVNDSESEDYHWWFWDAEYIEEIPVSGIAKDIIMRRPVVFNCFFRGIEGAGSHKYLRGLSVIKRRQENIESLINDKYPGIFTLYSQVELEYSLQIERAANTIREICSLLTELAPKWLGLPPLEETAESSRAVACSSSISKINPSYTRTHVPFSIDLEPCVSPRKSPRKSSPRTMSPKSISFRRFSPLKLSPDEKEKKTHELIGRCKSGPITPTSRVPQLKLSGIKRRKQKMTTPKFQ